MPLPWPLSCSGQCAWPRRRPRSSSCRSTSGISRCGARAAAWPATPSSRTCGPTTRLPSATRCRTSTTSPSAPSGCSRSASTWRAASASATSRSTVPSYYVDLVDIDTGRDIMQDLKLRTMPITATVRFVPTGRNAAVQPYIGAGIGIIPWKYSENGDFVDPSYETFPWKFEDSGTAVGPVVFGGVRVPVGRDVRGGRRDPVAAGGHRTRPRTSASRVPGSTSADSPTRRTSSSGSSSLLGRSAS